MIETLALVSKEPSPQNVPPPVAVPPILSYCSSDSTFKTQFNFKPELEIINCITFYVR